jgi:hypothetical protein
MERGLYLCCNHIAVWMAYDPQLNFIANWPDRLYEFEDNAGAPPSNYG